MTQVRVQAERGFPVALDDGVAYITDPARWPEYWPRFVALDPGSRWREPGDRARVTLRMLGRDVELAMTLRRLEPGRLVEYESEQRGFPGIAHRRRFDAVDGKLQLTISVEYTPRRGWRGGFDRYVLRRAVTRAVAETLDNLDRRFAAR
jgi:hypothetical protein